MIMAAGWSGPFFDGVGDAATWVGAIGTLAAFVVAFWQIRRERHHRLAEQLRQRRLAHREHADRVSAWITGGDLVISNMSEHPIHDVEAVLESARSTGHGVDEQIDRRTLTAPFAAPGETRIPAPHPPYVTVLPALTFTDARGDRWHRAPGERPELVTGSSEH